MIRKEAIEFALSIYQRWRGAPLNRAGLLLILAGIGELTSIIQNIVAFGFVYLSLPVPFSDPPPWVGLCIITLGIAAIIANRLVLDRSILPPAKTEPHPHDVKLYGDFRSLITLPTLEFLQDHDFGSLFHRNRLDPISRLGTEWRGPRFEFHDGIVEEIFRDVRGKAAHLSTLADKYTFVHNANFDMATTKPDNYHSDRESRRSAHGRVKILNDAATDLVNCINEFER